MAGEIMFRISDNPDVSGGDYASGDPIHIATRRATTLVHAEHIAQPRRAFTTDGLRSNDSISRRVFDAMYEYRFDRVSDTEVDRYKTDYMGNVIAGPHRIVFGVPHNHDGDPPRILQREYIGRRLRHPSHRIFGAPGSEVWHGGKQDTSTECVGRCWTLIETHTPHRLGVLEDDVCPHCAINHERWQYGAEDLRTNVAVRVSDVVESRAELLTRQNYENNDPDFSIGEDYGRILNKRILQMRAWPALRALLGFSAGQMNDRAVIKGTVRTLPENTPERAPWMPGRQVIVSEVTHLPDDLFLDLWHKPTNAVESVPASDKVPR